MDEDLIYQDFEYANNFKLGKTPLTLDYIVWFKKAHNTHQQK